MKFLQFLNLRRNKNISHDFGCLTYKFYAFMLTVFSHYSYITSNKLRPSYEARIENSNEVVLRKPVYMQYPAHCVRAATLK